ncbi:MOSC domain-containing protein [Dethiosulfatibacter aminovorans DSM 17477]|uniref:MOSC domain-containing protein n=1 Tax=Dethiosulfatibacter aminovorans DSM 17477 TaxID=1121476 RepID=A0A1M6LHP1_9FIRM|nr:MOSC domain-containing protein [Dethiosulfatibacter aminovorans]SHJ70719.1 MOSC domain-containing protein [Dethiosulfatibacter aminovorans DSM 17477]
MKGRIIAVNISDKKGITKTTIDEGNFIEEFGLEGDAHAGKWHRQVSLLGNESVKKMEEMLKGKGYDDCRGIFAENLTTEGIILYELPVGTKLKIGDVLMEVTQIGKECHEGCAIRNQVGKCVMPLEGIFTRVLKGGKIKPGDVIEVLED